MAALFRDPTVLVFVDEDNREFARITNASAVPRAGENIRLKDVPYLVERVGYDIPDDQIEKIYVVCQRL
jgi:hypothetical protein